MLQQPVKKEQTNGTCVTLQELVALRLKALHQPHLNKKNSSQSGQELVNIRGRGIDFDTIREYQAGDDIRNMAWRVTARSLKPHIKVYREEKERPVWLALDLSPSLYFGTRCMFKSVKCITEAALTGWSSLQKHERVGAIINTEQKAQVFQPHADEKFYLTILNSLAKASHLRPTFNEQHYLRHLLLSLQQHARSGSLIYIYSDFMQFNAETEKLILSLTQRAQVVLNFIYDPFEANPPPPHQYFVTNGQEKMLLNMLDTNNRENYRQFFLNKIKQIRNFAYNYKIHFHMHCTGITQGINT